MLHSEHKAGSATGPLHLFLSRQEHSLPLPQTPKQPAPRSSRASSEATRKPPQGSSHASATAVRGFHPPWVCADRPALNTVSLWTGGRLATRPVTARVRRRAQSMLHPHNESRRRGRLGAHSQPHDHARRGADVGAPSICYDPLGHSPARPGCPAHSPPRPALLSSRHRIHTSRMCTRTRIPHPSCSHMCCLPGRPSAPPAQTCLCSFAALSQDV